MGKADISRVANAAMPMRGMQQVPKMQGTGLMGNILNNTGMLGATGQMGQPQNMNPMPEQQPNNSQPGLIGGGMGNGWQDLLNGMLKQPKMTIGSGQGGLWF